MSKSSTNHTKTSKRIVIIVFVIILTVLVLASIIGYFAINYLSKPILSDQQEAITQLAGDIDVYPDAYLSANLPQYPDAELISLSKKTDTAKEAVSLVVNSNDSSETIAKYFDEKLKTHGWTAKADTVGFTDEPYAKEYRKDDQSFIVLINSSSNQDYKTTVSITWRTVD